VRYTPRLLHTLYIFICIHIYIYIYFYLYVYIYIYTTIHIVTGAAQRATRHDCCTPYIYSYIYIYIYMYIYIYTHIYIYISLCIHMHIYNHTYSYWSCTARYTPRLPHIRIRKTASELSIISVTHSISKSLPPPPHSFT